VFCQCNF